MSNPFDFFEAIYCINLDTRKDRWEQVQEEFSRVDILNRVQRFSAVKDTDGRMGLVKSTLEIVKEAKNRNLKNVLIFEDDVQFINEPLATLEKALSQIDMEWHLLYLGATPIAKLNPASENLLKIRKVLTTHAYSYSQKMYDILIERYQGLEKFRKDKDTIDWWLAHNIHPKYPCLLINPMIAIQKTSYSDIEKKEVDYTCMEKYFKKYTKHINRKPFFRFKQK